jgi:hypothetical protein
MAGQPNQLTKHSPVLFTTTSGTTGARKYISMTRQSRRSKARLTWLWLAALYRDHPGIVDGRILSVVSPEVESYAPSGVPCGAESGHAYRTMPKPIQSMYTAPYGVFSVKDYEARYYTLLRLAAGQAQQRHCDGHPEHHRAAGRAAGRSHRVDHPRRQGWHAVA